MVARQKSVRRTTKGKGGPVRVFIAKGCGKVMNNRRKKTKEF